MRMIDAAFLLHPQSNDPYAARRRAAELKPWAKYLPAWFVYALMPYITAKPDVGYAEVVSNTGDVVRLHFGAIPMSPDQLKRYEQRAVMKCIYCIDDMVELFPKLAIAGLGAHTASIGHGGRNIAGCVRVPVTTGNSLTTYYGIRSVLKAAEAMHIWPGRSTLCLVGASGNIGRAVGKLIRPEFARMLLVPNKTDLAQIAHEIEADVVPDINDAMRQSDVVITATTSSMLNCDFRSFKPGSVVVVLSRPRDIATEIMEKRKDVLAIEGGNVLVPNVERYVVTRDIEQPVGMVYPCMAETMVLALDGVPYCSMGDLQTEHILDLGKRAERHGFSLAPGFRFHREIPLSEINARYQAGRFGLR